LGPRVRAKDRRQRALAVVAGMIGGVVLARGTVKSDAHLSDEILDSVRAALADAGGERKHRVRALPE
jgi:hypothetical protein